MFLRETIRNPDFISFYFIYLFIFIRVFKDSPQNLVTGRDPVVPRGNLLSYAKGSVWVGLKKILDSCLGNTDSGMYSVDLYQVK